MDPQRWLGELDALLRQLEELDLGYPQGENSLQLPSDPKLVGLFTERFSGFSLDEFLSFHALSDGAVLQDIHNGIFLHPLAQILEGVEAGEPTRTTGEHAGAILPFGSDGGGERFVLTTDGGILHLAGGAVRAATFDGTNARIRQISGSFNGFLERVLQDVGAFVNQTPGWQFLT